MSEWTRDGDVHGSLSEVQIAAESHQQTSTGKHGMILRSICISCLLVSYLCLPPPGLSVEASSRPLCMHVCTRPSQESSLLSIHSAFGATSDDDDHSKLETQVSANHPLVGPSLVSHLHADEPHAHARSHERARTRTNTHTQALHLLGESFVVLSDDKSKQPAIKHY